MQVWEVEGISYTMAISPTNASRFWKNDDLAGGWEGGLVGRDAMSTLTVADLLLLRRSNPAMPQSVTLIGVRSSAIVTCYREALVSLLHRFIGNPHHFTHAVFQTLR